MTKTRWADLEIADLKAAVYSRNGKVQRMISFLTMVPIPCFLKDSRGRVLHMNALAEVHWHVTIDQARGRTMSEILQMDDSDRRVVERQDGGVLKKDEPHVYLETMGADLDNSVRRFSVLKFPLKDEDGESLLVAMVLPHLP